MRAYARVTAWWQVELEEGDTEAWIKEGSGAKRTYHLAGAVAKLIETMSNMMPQLYNGDLHGIVARRKKTYAERISYALSYDLLVCV